MSSGDPANVGSLDCDERLWRYHERYKVRKKRTVNGELQLQFLGAEG